MVRRTTILRRGKEACVGRVFALVCAALAIGVSQCAIRAVAADRETELVERRRARIKLLPAPPTPPEVTFPVNNEIDRFIAAGWPKAPSVSGADGKSIDPALCDDATFCRRVYLDTIGIIPTLTELNKFLADTSAEKRSRLIDQLLARRAEYAAHWTPFWEDALASQNVPSQGGILTRGDYRQWLLDCFEHDRPFDVMVAELLDPSMPGRKQVERPEVFGSRYNVEFVRNENHTVTLQTAANIGQVFLGTSMKCASCHDHFENREWSQQRFLGFASLFASRDLEQVRCEVHTGNYVSARWPFDLPGGESPSPADPAMRLHQAAQWVVDPANGRFAPTIINRLWRRYFGLGLFEPIDDFRNDTLPSHPELLAWLTHDFLAHDCQLQHTVRLILSSRTYQLKYDPQLADAFDAARPNEPRWFRSPGLRRLTAEQYIDSARLATAEQLNPAERTFLDARSTALARALGRPSSRNEISTARSEEVGAVQSLELLNGHELQTLLDEAAVLHKPIRKTDLPKLVDRAYRTILSRPPTADERRLGLAFLSSAATYSEGVKDLYWSLLCSPEFAFIR